jgi:CRP-like cAMP-binding protein
VYSTVYRKKDGYHVLHKDFWLKNVNTLNAGTSFGEVAIMGKQLCTRNASIFCGKESTFAVLDKDNFQRKKSIF